MISCVLFNYYGGDMMNDINFKNIGELIVDKQTISKVYCSNIQLWHGKEKFIRFKTRNSGALKLYKIQKNLVV